MSYLMRDDAGFAENLWNDIDSKVVNVAKTILTGRKFIDVYGPLGAGTQVVKISDLEEKGFAELVEINEDFVFTWKEIEYAKKMGQPLPLAKAAQAAAKSAQQEEKLIYLGDETHEGLLTAAEAKRVKMSGWDKGDSAFKAVAEGLQHMLVNGVYGEKVLVVSPDVSAALQHLTTGTGTLESERIAALIDGRIFQTPVLPEKTAILVAAGEQNLDLVIGQDMVTGYLGAEDLNHGFRILETLLLRIKNNNAIVVYEG